MVKLNRYFNNPVLKPEYRWEKGGVFNPTIFYTGKKLMMFYRAVDEKGVSRIGYAESNDGVNFKKADNPIIEPEFKWEKYGIEDPRLTYVGEDSMFYMTYVAIDNEKFEAPRTALIESKDLRKFEKKGIISKEYNKDVVIFPKKFEGKYAVLHRPYGKNVNKASIRISFQESLSNIKDGKEVIKAEERKVGAGFVLDLNDYWLLIYHEVLNNKEYVAKAALLEYDNPSKLIAKTREPILMAEENYEKEGRVKNVVFPTAGFINEGNLYVYYGAADYCIGLAYIEVQELIRCILTTGSSY